MRKAGLLVERVFAASILSASLLAVSGILWAAGESVPTSAPSSDPAKVQPYIESLKQKYDITPQMKPVLPPPAPLAAPATTQVFSSDPQKVQPYIESLREREGLGPPSVPGAQPYLESLKAGKELQPRFPKEIKWTMGLAAVATNKFKVTSETAQAHDFSSVYNIDNDYSLGIDLSFEHEFFHNPYAGAFGLVSHVGVIMPQGYGFFRNGSPSDTRFKFIAIPVSVGAGYRLAQLRYVVPFVQLMAVAVPFLETRDDGGDDKRGWSRGVNAVGGVAFNLDWMWKKGRWEAYADAGIIHTYLVAQIEYIRSIASKVNFDYDGGYVGFMFEF